MKIPRTDVNGKILQDGDIVAEGKIDELIWDGEAIIIQRPLGIVTISKNPKSKVLSTPEETDFYNVIQIRPGVAKLTNSARDFLKANADEINTIYLHLSRYDGKFYNWENIEVIGSVYDFRA